MKNVNDIVDNILDNIMHEEVTLSDFKDYIDDLRKKGFDDEKKLQGMLNKAKQLAKEQGKEGDKETILGIFQSFFEAK